MACRDKILDAFVACEALADEETDVYVMSVKHGGEPNQTYNVSGGGTIASDDQNFIVNDSSAWLVQCAGSTQLEVGDVIRIGSLDTTALHTDYLTVLEVLPDQKLYNGIYVNGASTSKTIPTVRFGHYTASNQDAVTYTGPIVTTDVSGDVSFAFRGSLKNGVAVSDTRTLYRVNAAINATMPQVPITSQANTDADATSDSIKHRDPKLYYPVYRVRRPADPVLQLDHGVKGLSWIKLMGYSLVNKRQVGYTAQDMRDGDTALWSRDDWIAVHIKEIGGKVVSNNSTAHGAFAVLHGGQVHNNTTGAIEYHEQDPQGLVTHVFDTHETCVRKLTFQFLDRMGDKAHVGRVHLWLRLCVAHG